MLAEPLGELERLDVMMGRPASAWAVGRSLGEAFDPGRRRLWCFGDRGRGVGICPYATSRTRTCRNSYSSCPATGGPASPADHLVRDEAVQAALDQLIRVDATDLGDDTGPEDLADDGRHWRRRP